MKSGIVHLKLSLTFEGDVSIPMSEKSRQTGLGKQKLPFLNFESAVPFLTFEPKFLRNMKCRSSTPPA